MPRFTKNKRYSSNKMRRETEGWTKGGKNGQILFYRTYPATVGGPKQTINRDTYYIFV